MKNRFFNIAVLVLLLMNTAAICYFFMKKPQQPEHPKQDGAFDFMMKQLQFTKEQTATCEQYKKVYKQRQDSIGKNEKRYIDNLFGLLKNPNTNDSIVVVAAKQLAYIQESRHVSTFYFFKQIRSICNDAQKEKFNVIFEKVLRMNDGKRRMPPPNENNEHERMLPGEHDGRMPPPNEGEEHEGMPPPNK